SSAASDVYKRQSLISVFQGGPLLILWPLGFMVGSWVAGITMYLIHALWLVPILAWVLLVSSFANRMPFVWAVLTPGVAAVMEKLFLDTNVIGSWIGIHLGGWIDGALNGKMHDFQGPEEVLRYLIGGPQMEALQYSVTSLQFWAGLVIAAGLVYGAIEKRKHAA
ncbi:MAG: hypothetical protein KUG56_07335, partial [Kordiimonadaceae bacterium]|nr:hypothetical protein [Kordiimonadaceae bacterium]